MTDSPTARRPFLIATALLVLLPFGSAPVAAETGVRLDGPRVQGGLLRGRVPPGSTVEYEGDAVRVSQDGWFLVGFGRDAPPEAELAVVYPDGRSERQVLKVEGRKYNIQRIDGLPPSKVTPSEEDLVRIRAEVKMVKKARAVDDARTDFLSGFQWPVKGVISGVYGSQRTSTASRAGRISASTSRRPGARRWLRRRTAWSPSCTPTCTSPAAP